MSSDAYYGTSQVEAAAILEGRRFLPRHGEEQYLGAGVYFFDGSPEDAVRWAQQRSPREWAVLRCRVEPGRCLDLHTRTGGELLARLVAGLSAARGGEPVREGDAIKLLARFTALDSVRSVHRRPAVRSKGFNRRSAPSPDAPPDPLQTILCVRNLANIHDMATFRIGG